MVGERRRLGFAVSLLPTLFLGAVILPLLLTWTGPAYAQDPPPRLILQHEYIRESGGRDFHDPSIFYFKNRFHAQVWLGEFTKGVEVGGYDKDKRGSAYSAFYRFRDGFDHILQVETEQITGTTGYVLALGARYIRVIPDVGARNMVQFHVGADKYYGDYNFASLRAISDPRRSGRWTFVLSNRFATEDSYVTLGVVPRTDGEVGYFMQAKQENLRFGVGHYSRFDFTQRNRTIYNLGWEWELE
ncbi:MAG: hypothetical protein GTO55_03025 [Armatimonadetes bacterium]|nr:hypothetical protein [Armatimonadota bacterium]NIM23248.1 hypothetical protein [Armatimonadota bacterium]NIM67116.1 hypothetical protein [Armatimonadota bacterium]NIM75643.1 hypothetical protein [Armatimonadota bacterium]NIN05305.1 hypothetical protein [Armatimonadota bacterium]